VPRNWHVNYDQVTDNFRVIDPADFRVSCDLGTLAIYGRAQGQSGWIPACAGMTNIGWQD
jgi:hypothetical protein